MKKLQKLSVCIPTYNGARYIGECIESIINQSFSDFELIISDDSSTDDTLKIIQSYSDPRIKFFSNNKKLGLVGNWNRCIELAEGEYINIFHQDDVMCKDNLLEKVNNLDNNKNVGLVYSDVYQINSDSEIVSNGWFFKSEKSSNDFIMQGRSFFEDLISGFNIVCCPSVMVKRSCYMKLEGFDKRLPFSADWEMWLRIALFYDIAYLKEPLIKYRVHNENETNNFKGLNELEQYFSCKFIALTRFPNRVPNQQKLKTDLIELYEGKAIKWSYHYYKSSDFKQAQESINMAFNIRAKGLIKKSMPRDYQKWFQHQIEDMTRIPVNTFYPESAKDQAMMIPFKELVSVLWVKFLRKINSFYKKNSEQYAKQA